MLVRLLYYSEVAEIKTTSDITDILKAAEEYNKKNGLTGCLYFDEKYFIQVLEGDRQKVSSLYHKIAKDKRHKNIVLVDVSTIAKRDFAAWTILYLGKIKPKEEVLIQFSPDVDFNPTNMSAQNIIEFTLTLKTEAIK